MIDFLTVALWINFALFPEKLMGFMNHLVNFRIISKYVGKGTGIKGWLLAIFTGTLSHGPIYVWYPLLSDLRNQGMRSCLIATFPNSRAIKIPLLPLMAHNFGVLFVVILAGLMIVASVLQDYVVEMLETRIPNDTKWGG